VAGAASFSSVAKMLRKKFTIPSTTDGSLLCAAAGGDIASDTTAPNTITAILNRISPSRTRQGES
jgi:hypothetical protein